jgi:hypothetical protein
MTEVLCEDLLAFLIFVVAGKAIFVFVQVSWLLNCIKYLPSFYSEGKEISLASK